MARPPGQLYISEEVRAAVPRQFIAQAIAHLRTGGGVCFLCGEELKAWQSLSAVADVASTGTALRFMHTEHGPSQVREMRRDRRFSVTMGHFVDEMITNAYGFASFWSIATPPAGLIISPQMLQGTEPDVLGQVHNPWFDAWETLGVTTVSPPLVVAQLPALEDAEVLVGSDDTVTASIGDVVVFTGNLPIPKMWRNSIQQTGTCRLLITQIALVSDKTGGSTPSIIDRLAKAGAVRGGLAYARLTSANAAPPKTTSG